MVKLILQFWPNINQPGYFDQTALEMAVKRLDFDLCKFLLRLHADPALHSHWTNDLENFQVFNKNNLYGQSIINISSYHRPEHSYDNGIIYALTNLGKIFLIDLKEEEYTKEINVSSLNNRKIEQMATNQMHTLFRTQKGEIFKFKSKFVSHNNEAGYEYKLVPSYVKLTNPDSEYKALAGINNSIKAVDSLHVSAVSSLLKAEINRLQFSKNRNSLFYRAFYSDQNTVNKINALDNNLKFLKHVKNEESLKSFLDNLIKDKDLAQHRSIGFFGRHFKGPDSMVKLCELKNSLKL